jgi:hypothetical protein
MLRAILLVVVLVLVLDLFWGINRSARVTRAARFGRSLSLPALSLALCLEQIDRDALLYSERIAAVAGLPPSIRATRFRAVV